MKKLTSLYDSYLVDQFVDQVIRFYQSNSVRVELAGKLSQILSCSEKLFENKPALYYRISVAKLVIEAVPLTTNRLQIQVVTNRRGRALKKESYQTFISRFFKNRKPELRDKIRSNDRGERLVKLIPKYEQTCRQSGFEGVGELLLAYLEGRLLLPPRWIRKKRSSQIIDALDTTGFNDFWLSQERFSSERHSPLVQQR